VSHLSKSLSPLAVPLTVPLTAAIVIAVGILAAMQSASWAAAPLLPGGSNQRPGLSLPNYTAPSGVPANFSQVLAGPTPFAYVGTFTGNVTSEVLRDPGTGNLAFSYRFNNLFNGNANEINRASIDDPSHPWTGVNIFDSGSDFSGNSTKIGAGGWADGSPYDIERDSVLNGIAAQFSQLGTGTSLTSANNSVSSLIWVATNAKHFGVSDVSLLDGGPGGTSFAYAPAVPEPATLLLSVIGCLGCALMIRRQRRTI
jgi:hypothetical protein